MVSHGVASIICQPYNEDDFKKWEGWVHSRLRLLVQAVERCSQWAVIAHPFPVRHQDPGRGVIENKHSTNVESTSRVHVSILAFTLKASLAPTSFLF